MMSNYDHDQFINKTPVFKDLNKQSYQKLVMLKEKIETRIQQQEHQNQRDNSPEPSPNNEMKPDTNKERAKAKYLRYQRDHQALIEVKAEMQRQENLTKEHRDEFNKNSIKPTLNLEKKKELERQFNEVARNREQGRER